MGQVKTGNFAAQLLKKSISKKLSDGLIDGKHS